MESLNILYVGENSSLRAALELQARDWNIMQPESVHDALAMYVLYFPDVIVLEGCADMVREVYYHLASGITQSSPQMVEAMLVVDDGERWHTPANTVLKQIPANSDVRALLRAIEDVRTQSMDEAAARHQKHPSLMFAI
jgi:hypothetical protein